jgi:hypothetical protein
MIQNFHDLLHINASQLLLFVTAASAAAAISMFLRRLDEAVRHRNRRPMAVHPLHHLRGRYALPGFWLGVTIYLVASVLRDGIPTFAGMKGWTDTWVHVSNMLRLCQIAGQLTVWWAATHDTQGHCTWLGVLAAGILFAAIL